MQNKGRSGLQPDAFSDSKMETSFNENLMLERKNSVQDEKSDRCFESCWVKLEAKKKKKIQVNSFT